MWDFCVDGTSLSDLPDTWLRAISLSSSLTFPWEEWSLDWFGRRNQKNIGTKTSGKGVPPLCPPLLNWWTSLDDNTWLEPKRTRREKEKSRNLNPLLVLRVFLFLPVPSVFLNTICFFFLIEIVNGYDGADDCISSASVCIPLRVEEEKEENNHDFQTVSPMKKIDFLGRCLDFL